jgi:hypothetical protein
MRHGYLRTYDYISPGDPSGGQLRVRAFGQPRTRVRQVGVAW